jgi:hypothetical protein
LSYSQLSPVPISSTIALLAQRIRERFPESGLSRVGDELIRVSDENTRVVEQLGHPIWWLRALTALAIAALVAVVIWAGSVVLRIARTGDASLTELLQGVDAGTNLAILLAIAILFLVSLETRTKRRTALGMLHRLRSIAHVVDMHQLTKDPEHATHEVPRTASSPERDLDPGQLARYLDYCSELLALTSKLAALHAQHLQDPVVLDAVNDIESLTADLSRKIWQKITILDVARLPESSTSDAAG